MKAGDRVRIREVLPVEWPELCVDRQALAADYTGHECAFVGADKDGLAVVMPTGQALGWENYDYDYDGRPELPCLVVPAAALEPVVPPLPDGWTVERLGHRATLLAPNGLRAARIEGGGMHLWATEYHAPADLLAALAYLVALAGGAP